MDDQRTHYVTTTDGVTIGGTVHGVGPPLVLLHGGVGDGDLDWSRLAAHLADRFTCHMPSMRGRGLSSDHPDLSPGRQVDDMAAYVDSVGGPTALAGWSYGAGLALGVAAQCPAVTAVAASESAMSSVMDEQEQATVGAAVARTAELAAEDNMTAAVRAFCGWPFNDGELAVAEYSGYFEAAGRYVPNLLGLFQQLMEAEDPTSDAVLGVISVPVLALHGSDTRPFFAASARYVADHVPNGRVYGIQGAGHAALLAHAEALAEVLAEFFAAAVPRS